MKRPKLIEFSDVIDLTSHIPHQVLEAGTQTDEAHMQKDFMMQKIIEGIAAVDKQRLDLDQQRIQLEIRRYELDVIGYQLSDLLSKMAVSTG